MSPKEKPDSSLEDSGQRCRTSDSRDKSSSSTSNGTEDSRVTNGSVLSEAEEKELLPDTVCGHLQLVFALLQFSNRRYDLPVGCSYLIFSVSKGYDVTIYLID